MTVPGAECLSGSKYKKKTPQETKKACVEHIPVLLMSQCMSQGKGLSRILFIWFVFPQPTKLAESLRLWAELQCNLSMS